MRIHPRLRTVALSAAAASGVLTLLAAARPAAAQTELPTASDNQPIAALRGGVYFPFNSNLKNNGGKTLYSGGLDYVIQHKVGQNRTELSVDYIERSSGGHDIRIIPVTIGSFTLQSGQNGVRPYVGVGVGAYFVHQNLPDDSGVNQNSNKVAIGGYIGAGLDLPSNFLVEARYHILQRVGTYNSDGLEVMAGIRF
jgi:outer membrane protein W